MSETHQARTTSTESEMCEQRVEEDLQDQIEGLRREINELRLVVYALLQRTFRRCVVHVVQCANASVIAPAEVARCY